MRFMVMHKVGKSEPRIGDPDLQRIIQEMGALIQESLKSGVFTNGAGLKNDQIRTRLKFKNGDLTRRDGPYAGSNELLAGFAMISVKSKDEAIEWARKYAKVVGDVELELGSVTEAWDLGVVPKPTGVVPERYLMLHMAGGTSEAGTPPTAGEMTAMGALMGEMSKAGVLQMAEGVLPSSQAKRLQFKAGKVQSIVDGPFTESKELIGGFSLLNLPGWDAAVAWTTRYGGILRDQEVDVRLLHDVPAFG